MLRIALIDECPEHTATLAARLADQPHLELVACGSLGSGIVDALASEPPDVVVLDAPPQPETVRQAVAAIHHLLPHTGLVVTALDDDHDHIRQIWAASGEAFVPHKRLFREPEAVLDPPPW